jgi:hypothetical protein
LATTARCGSTSSDEVCSKISSHPDGIRLAECSQGKVTLDHIQYDRNGGKLSYNFIVSCQGRSARGHWDRQAGLTCLEGATDPCQAGGVCKPTSDDDCRNIANCKEWGDCGYNDGKCVPTEDGCAKSDVPCGLSGQCHLGPAGTCVVLTNSDCQAPFGDCADCPYKGACAISGTCYAENGQCVARENTDCKKSSQCKFAGNCSLSAGACIAATDADCTLSEVCRTARQCTAIGGVCTVKPAL